MTFANPLISVCTSTVVILSDEIWLIWGERFQNKITVSQIITMFFLLMFFFTAFEHLAVVKELAPFSERGGEQRNFA